MTREDLRNALDAGTPLDRLGEDARPHLAEAFPLVAPTKLLRLLAGIVAVQVDSRSWQVWYQTPTGGRLAFKAPAALMLLASGAAKKPNYTVFTTGSWGRALVWAAEELGLSIRFDVRQTANVDLLRTNELNTDAPAAQWGVLQSLRSIPRPPEIKSIRCRVTQGHLRAALERLGYRVSRGSRTFLLTEVQ